METFRIYYGQLDNLLMNYLNSSNIDTVISWVGGHIDLKPNDLADDLAKKAAEEARGLTESPPLSYSEFKNLIKISSLKKWQTYWTNNISHQQVSRNQAYEDC